MSSSRYVSLTFSAITIIVGTSAVAQEASPALKTVLAGLTENGASATVHADIDQDGEMEALVTYDSDCGPGGCLFSIVDVDAEGQLGEVAYQYGQAPGLVSDGTVIDANGVFWTWNGAALLPYYDFFEDLEFYSGTERDVATIRTHEPWRPVLRNYDIRMANIDLIGSETPERFVWLKGSEYKIGQASPYFVFDDAGQILMQGAFIDRPYLFKLNDRKATALIAHNGSGFTTTILE